jgi:hypothetical protein
MAEEYTRPGWYPDPDGTPGERWWNGSGWSDSRRGGTPVAAVASVAATTSPRPDPYATPAPAVSAPMRNIFTIDARQNRMSVAALVTGLIGLFGFSVLGPVAIVFGLIGISRARQLRAQGTAGSTLVLATVGFVAGLIATFLLIVAIIAFAASITFDYDPS